MPSSFDPRVRSQIEIETFFTELEALEGGKDRIAALNHNSREVARDVRAKVFAAYV